MTIENKYTCISINAPELKTHKAFVEWLHLRSLATCGLDEAYGFVPETVASRLATWHAPSNPCRPKAPGEYSDIFMWVDRGEGSDSDMPKDVWNEIITIVGPDFSGVVWISFLEDSELPANPTDCFPVLP